MKKQNSYFVEERELDIKKGAQEILKKWRFILVLAILAAVITVAVDYKTTKENAVANAIAAADAANADPVTIESLESSMTDDELQRVWRYVYMSTTLEQKREYQTESILMNINPYAEDVVDLQYQVSSTDNEEAQTVVNDYVSYLQSDTLGADIVDILQLEIDKRYVNELIQVETTGTGFKVRVRAASQEECSRLADGVESAVENYAPGVSQLANPYELTLAERVNDVVMDEQLINVQSNYSADIGTYYTLYLPLQSSLDNRQATLANMILAQGMTSANSILPSEETAAEERTYVEPEAVSVSVNLKKVPLGLVAGILVAICCIIIVYAVSQNIHGMQEMKYLFGVRDMGTISALPVKKKKPGSGIDRLIDKICMGRRNYAGYEQQLELISSTILLACQKEGVNHVVVAGSRLNLVPKALLEQLKELLAKKGITMETGGNVNRDAAALLRLAEVGNCVLLEVDEKSNCNDIVKELNICRENDVRMLGAVMVSNC